MRDYLKSFKRALFILFIFCFTGFVAGPLRAEAAAAKLNEKSVSLYVGDSCQLTVKGKKGKGKKGKVIWASSDTSVATVSSKGKVKAREAGEAVITATIGKKELTCRVTVRTKASKNAAKLRNYILKKGKYDKEAGCYYIQWVTGSGKKKITGYLDKDYNLHRVMIKAFKKTNDLIFFYSISPDAPDSVTTVEIKIDLVTGKTAVASGDLMSTYLYTDNWDNEAYYGGIDTSFDGQNQGLFLKRITMEEEHYDEDDISYPVIKEYTDSETLAQHLPKIINRTSYAFPYWNKFLKSNKSLKNLTMKNMGFASWTN